MDAKIDGKAVKQLREICTNYGYRSQGATEASFGLGDAAQIIQLDLESFPNSGYSHAMLGIAQAKLGKGKQAVEHLQKAVKLLDSSNELDEFEKAAMRNNIQYHLKEMRLKGQD